MEKMNESYTAFRPHVSRHQRGDSPSFFILPLEIFKSSMLFSNLSSCRMDSISGVEISWSREAPLAMRADQAITLEYNVVLIPDRLLAL